LQEPAHDQRYAPPQAHVEDVPEPADRPVLASRWERLRASLVDMVISVATWWGALFLAGRNPWAAPGGWEAIALNGLLAFVLFAAIHGYTLATSGQTLGKKVVGIRIARRDGSPASLGRLVGLRYGVGYLLGLIPSIGWIYGFVDSLMIFRDSRRCLHDVIADTIVLKA
jgi:uncharacterized RDD family membrane protein YckC